MTKRNQLQLAAALVLGAAGFSASAQTTIFTSGAINGTVNGWGITPTYEAASSFTLTNPATIDNATFGLWVSTGETLTSVHWAITSSAGGTPLPAAAGTAIPSVSSLLASDFFGNDIYSESFTIPSIELGAGTYYLQLDHAVATGGALAYWDENDGPNSLAYYYNTTGSDPWQTYGTASLAFTLSGENSVPEPGTLALAGMGALVLGRFVRRQAGK